MPRNVAMQELITRCRQRADLENDEHIPAAEWAALISAMYGELYNVVSEAGLRHFESTEEFVGDGTQGFTLPTDHLATVGVDYIVGGVAAGDHSLKERRALTELEVNERIPASYLGSGEARFFSVVGQVVNLYPVPTSGQVYEMLYLPQPDNLADAAGGDSVDVVTSDGEEFLVWGVTVKAKAKRQENAEMAMAERDAARARLMYWAGMRSLYTARRRQVQGDPWDPGTPDPGDWNR